MKNPTAPMVNATAKKKRIIKYILVKAHLLAGFTITTPQCRKKYDYERLSDGIFKLRRQGMNIRTINQVGKDRYRNLKEWGEYVWDGWEPPSIQKQYGQDFHFVHKFPKEPPEIKVWIKDYLHRWQRRSKVQRITYMKKKKRAIVRTATGKKIFNIIYKP
jgi:hypothetical protein